MNRCFSVLILISYTQDGKTALYHAVDKGYVDCVRELLAAGANTEASNKV